jgi:triphosphatase
VGFGAAATAPRSFESRYFDTADQALRKAGFTLRVRKDGDRWTQTVKSRLAADGLGRGEWETPVGGGQPETNLVQATPARTFLDGAALAPLFEVHVKRRSLMVRETCCTMEVSLDAGEVSHPGRSSDFRELEPEFKQGLALVERLCWKFWVVLLAGSMRLVPTRR